MTFAVVTFRVGQCFSACAPGTWCYEEFASLSRNLLEGVATDRRDDATGKDGGADPSGTSPASNDNKTADELISGGLKRSPSYHGDSGGKTDREIKQLADEGDAKARQMKTLIQQGKRLGQKGPKRR